MSKIIIEKVKEIILPYLEEENIILFDIEYVFEDNENILRIYIDNEELRNKCSAFEIKEKSQSDFWPQLFIIHY